MKTSPLAKAAISSTLSSLVVPADLAQTYEPELETLATNMS